MLHSNDKSQVGELASMLKGYSQWGKGKKRK